VRPATAIGLLLIAIVALAAALFAPGQPMAARLCPHPVAVQGRTVSCSGSLAADPTPTPLPGAAARRP
jgi:hypothetical protein